MNFKKLILRHPGLKKLSHWLLFPTNDPRPRPWVNLLLNPFYHSRGRGVRIRRSVRMDVVPFNGLTIGDRAIIEDFTVINNGVGDVWIGHDSLIGLSNVIIGPVTIGDRAILAQHVVVSGLNHSYLDPYTAIKDQSIATAPIMIGEACWLGANVVVTAGVTVGRHCIIAAGSVVTKSIPPYSVAVGSPARVIKTYDFSTKAWVKVN